MLEMLKSQYGGISLGDDKDTEDFKYFTYLDFPKFSSDHKNIMSHNLTKKMFDNLKHKITSNGFTFSNAIQSGVEAPSLSVGLVAGDSECYDVFKEIFFRVIKICHNFDPFTETHRAGINPDKLDLKEFQKLDPDQYILSSRIRAVRNISGFLLPPGISPNQRMEIEKILKSIFKNFTGNFKGVYHHLGDLDDKYAASLRKNGMLFQNFDSTTVLFNSGSARHWPKGRGIFLNKEENIACWVNEEDHCRISAIEKGANIKKSFENFAKLSEALERNIKLSGHSIMKHNNLGILSTCPSNVGTGLRASVKIKIPKLIAHRNYLNSLCTKYHLAIRGEDGEGLSSSSNILDVSNKETIGFTETELVQKLITGITKIIQEEKAL